LHTRIDTYDPPYIAVASQTSGGTANSPQEFAFDGALELFSASQGSNSVTIYVPPYTGAPQQTVAAAGVSEPTGVYIGP
jgi:hypothetical protein